MTLNAASHSELDPITFEVLRNLFEHGAERMSTVLRRTSFSPVMYDLVDFSNAMFTPNLELVGQAANCPAHLGAMHFSAQAAVDEFGIDGIGEDDIVLLNDPYDGGTHNNDVTWTKPVLDEENELLGFCVSRGHWTDLGGGGPGSQSWGTHIAEEGLRISPTKIVKDGELNETLVELIKNNTRTPNFIEGDIQARWAALTAGTKELKRMERKYGADTVRQGMNDVIEYTETRTRNAIEDIPDGKYTATDYGDCDGINKDSVYITVTLTVDGDDIEVDFTGTDDLVLGSVNSPKANTYSAVYYALKFFTDPDAPPNDGMYRPIDIHIPDGCWLKAEWPRPVYGCTTFTGSKICATIWQALAKAIPEEIAAPTYSECNGFAIRQESTDELQGHVWPGLPPGGWGGTPYGDGMDTTIDPLGNCEPLPVERTELLYPVRVDHREFIPDSGGPGEHRGGLGMRLTYTFDSYTEVSIETSRTKEGTPGVNDGKRGSRGLMVRNIHHDNEEVIGGWTRDGDEWKMSIIGSEPFQPGGSFTLKTQGGGGWGDPTDRNTDKIIDDLKNEKITPEAATDVYGLDPDKLE